ncbi:sugar ABC transporter substrate-binding protein [Salirhabdus salicampi]|uniref:sugar ABC transporter substrate-binding protein n=1 Tax=Salirhabdus salicampi TaxID=476102 RepID=UPI0020C33751|nr:substrate-binding domain-containing protein [Salirhabdus salicampi]MCP8617696.1 substrate-binding domain-containing protein [Salirhabdus salicampi]
MKKFSLVVVSIIMVLSLMACSNTTSGDDKPRVSILTPYLSSVTTKQMVDELEQMAEEKGWEVNIVDTKGDVGALASRMEDVISSGTDAIVLVSTDPNQVHSQILSASEKNIPVFGCDASYIDGMTLNATSDNSEMGNMISEHLFELMGGEGNLIVLTHRPHPGVLKRTEALDKLLSDYPNINVITEQEVQVPGPIENARKQMENLLLANQGEDAITAVWAGWDEPAIGVTQALNSVNRDNVVVTGIDGNSQAVELIEEGGPFKATVKQNFVGMAEIVIDQMEKVFAGEEVDGTELYAPAELITAE